MNTAAAPRVTATALLGDVLRGLDALDDNRSRLVAAERLELVRLARAAASRLTALAAVLVAEAEAARAAEQSAGTPLKTWLGRQEPLSRGEASGVVHRARSIGEHPALGRAGVDGTVSAAQSRSITRVLDSLTGLDAAQKERAEELMIGWAGQLDARQLENSAGRVLAEVAPTDADDLLEARLQREAEAAQRNRALSFFREGGSVRFEGSLPRVEGEQLIALVNGAAEAIRRTAAEARDPLAETSTVLQRRADALMAVIRAAATAGPIPGAGAAKVIVKLDYDKLRDQAAGAALVGVDQPISAGELRRLCCDAELVPAVLGGASAVLDLGHSVRLVSPEQRTALIVRDGGCAFPGCDLPPELSEAHHIIPWYLGGPTCLANLVLLCKSHHGLCEPARHATRDQWRVRIAPDGAAEFIPPARLDRAQVPLRHCRHAPPEQNTG
jgi:hypothetical protein